MGAVDLVIQVEAPPSAASGLQRIGRAGHQVGEVSRAALFPKHRGDVLHTAIVTERMLAGRIEAISVPQNPLDILAQQTVAACAHRTRRRRGLVRDGQAQRAVPLAPPFGVRGDARSARRAVPVGRVRRAPAARGVEPRSRRAHRPTRGPADRRHERRHDPRPRPVRRLRRGRVAERARRRARRGDGLRVTRRTTSSRWARRAGGSSTSRTIASTSCPHSVSRARCRSGTATGSAGPPSSARRSALSRARCRRPSAEIAEARLREAGLDANARGNLLAYLAEQREATGTLPTDRTPDRRARSRRGRRLAASSCTPRTGCPCTPRGRSPSTPGSASGSGVDGSAVASDDGIIARIPDATAEPPGRRAVRLRSRRARAARDRRGRRIGAVRLAVPGVRGARSAAAATQSRTAAARCGSSVSGRRSCSRSPAGIRPSRSSSRRSARSSRMSTTCPALLRIARGIGERRIRLVETEPAQPSPYARDLLFGYVGAFMYEGDSPARRAPRRRAVGGPGPAVRAPRQGRDARAARPRHHPAVRARGAAARPRAPRARHRGGRGSAPDAGTPRCRRGGARLRGSEAAATRPRDGAAASTATPRPRPRHPLTSTLSSRPGARSRSRSPACRGWPRSKTPAACAMRSARRCPSASRPPSSIRSPTRWATSSRGTRARTGRSRRTGRGAASASASRSCARRFSDSNRRGASRSGFFLPAAAGGGGRRDRVVRQRGAAPAADALARGDPRERRARLAGRVCALPPGLAARHATARGHRRRRGRHRAARGRADPGERVGVARAALPRRGLHARRCSTSSPRPARSSGRATARSRDATAGSPCIPADAASLTLLRRGGRDRAGLARGAAARGARHGRRVLRRPAAAADRRRERAVDRRGAVEPHVERPGHQ